MLIQLSSSLIMLLQSQTVTLTVLQTWIAELWIYSSAGTCTLISQTLTENWKFNLTRLIYLFFNSINSSPLPAWDDYMSGLSVCGDSELNDPQYDQSLLENLFYKTPVSRGFSDEETCFMCRISQCQCCWFFSEGYFKLLCVFSQMSDVRTSDTEAKGQGRVSSTGKQLTQSGVEISAR